MVYEHLPVVFTAVLDVDDQYLLQPKRQLHQVVTFEESGDAVPWELGPKLLQIQPIIRFIHEILKRRSVAFLCVSHLQGREVPCQETRTPWHRAEATLVRQSVSAFWPCVSQQTERKGTTARTWR